MKLIDSLPTALKANAVFSTSCGLGLIIFHTWWSAQFQLPSDLWLILGGGILIVFAAQLFYVVYRQILTVPVVGYFMICDLLYVLGAIVVTLVFLEKFSFFAITFLLLTSVLVLGLIVWQYRAFKFTSKKTQLS